MHRFMLKISRLMAYAGGVVLSLLVVMTSLSVAGRALSKWLHGDWFKTQLPETANWLLTLGIGPIMGDFELVEAGVGFAVFAFLPLCQITASHAAVDVFTSRLPARSNRVLAALTEVIFAAVLLLIAVQLARGLGSKYDSGQTTFLIQFPLWWAYAASLFGAVIAALVACYMAAMRFAEALSGAQILPKPEGAE